MLAIAPDNMWGGLAGIAMLALICAGYGYLLTGLSARRSGLDWIESFGLRLILGFIVCSWIGSILAVASLFSWWTVLFSAGAVAWVARNRLADVPNLATPDSSIGWSVLAACVLMGAAWLYARPSETFLVFEDSAIYTIGGDYLARYGTLIPEVTEQVCFTGEVERYWGQFKYWHRCSGTLSMAFLPVPKVWAAAFTYLLGDAGTVWVAPFSGFMGIYAVLLFLRRRIGSPWFILGTLLISVSFPQVWYSRTFMSETFAMTAIFGGAWLVGLARESRDQSGGISVGYYAAALLSMLAMIRIEAPVLLGLLISGWLLFHGWRPGLARDHYMSVWARRLSVSFSLLFVAGCILSFSAAPHYFVDALGFLLGALTSFIDRQVVQLGVIFGLVIAAIVVTLQRGKMLGKMLARVRSTSVHRRALVLLSCILVCAYGTEFLVGSYVADTGGEWVTRYIGTVSTVLGLVGLILLTMLNEDPEMSAMLNLTLVISVVFSISPLVSSVHPWAIRRFVPFILPIFLTGTTYSLKSLWSLAMHLVGQSRFRIATITLVVTSLSLCALAPLSAVTRPFVDYQELSGLWDSLEVLATQHYPDDSLLIFGDGPYATRIPQVMELIFGHSVVSIPEPLAEEDVFALDEAIRDVKRSGRRVIYTYIDGEVSWQSQVFGLAPYDYYVIEAPRLTYSVDPPPAAEDIATMRLLVDMYEVVPVAELKSAVGRRLGLPLSEGSRGYLRQGFYDLEYDESGRAYRWTEEEARINIPLPDAPSAGSYADVTLELAAWRPEGSRPPDVLVTAGGLRIEEPLMSGQFEPQTVRLRVTALDRLAAQELEIVISCQPWSPADYGMSDPRVLGVAYYGASVLFADTK